MMFVSKAGLNGTSSQAPKSKRWCQNCLVSSLQERSSRGRGDAGFERWRGNVELRIGCEILNIDWLARRRPERSCAG